MNGYYSRKTISNEVKRRVLMTGLEFDPTAVGALKSTLTRSFDVAEESIDVFNGFINQMLIESEIRFYFYLLL